MSAEKYVDIHGSWSHLSGWATIDYADAGSGYEWDEIHVLRGPDGRLYTGSGSGCSCNSFSDSDPSEFVRHMGWIDVANAVKAWIEGGGDWSRHERESAGMALIERLTSTKPAGYIEHDPRQGFRS